MAGGPHAETVPCLRCAEAAERISEGLETDWYRCTACGCRFGICFAEEMGGGGPPSRPLYPPTEEEAEAIRRRGKGKK